MGPRAPDHKVCRIATTTEKPPARRARPARRTRCTGRTKEIRLRLERFFKQSLRTDTAIGKDESAALPHYPTACLQSSESESSLPERQIQLTADPLRPNRTVLQEAQHGGLMLVQPGELGRMPGLEGVLPDETRR